MHVHFSTFSPLSNGGSKTKSKLNPDNENLAGNKTRDNNKAKNKQNKKKQNESRNTTTENKPVSRGNTGQGHEYR